MQYAYIKIDERMGCKPTNTSFLQPERDLVAGGKKSQN